MKYITNEKTGAKVLAITAEVTSTDVMEAVEKDSGTISRTSAKELLYERTTRTCGYTVTNDDVAPAAVVAPTVESVVAQVEAAGATSAEIAPVAAVAAVEKPAKKSGRVVRKYVVEADAVPVPQNGRMYVKMVDLIKASGDVGMTIEQLYAAFPDVKQNTIQNEIWRAKVSKYVTLVKGA